MSDETTLLPCPFCGGEAEVIEADYGMYMTGYAVYCRKCCLKLGVTGRLGETYEWSPVFNTEAEAIAAWNTRADTEYGGIPATEENMAKCGWVREEIVRCRDCRFYEETGNCNWFECSICWALAEVTPDGYCAWAERRSSE